MRHLILAVFLLGGSVFAAAPPVQFYKELNSSFGIYGKNREEGVKAVSRVVKRGNKYVYTYTLTNVGRSEWTVAWTIPNNGLFRDQNARLFNLKPGKSSEIFFEHDEPPVEVFGSVRCYNCKAIKRGLHEAEIKVSGTEPDLSLKVQFPSSGFLPESLIPKKEK